MNADELRFGATGPGLCCGNFFVWEFYFDSVDALVDKIVEWENMTTKRHAAVFRLKGCQSFYVDIIETVVAKNRTENIACSTTSKQGTSIKMCRETRQVLTSRLQQNEKIKFRNAPLGDEARIVVDGESAVRKRTIVCESRRFEIFNPSKGKKVFFDFHLNAPDPYWPPDIVIGCPTIAIEECCVCFETNVRAPRLKCGHGLCLSCFDSWKQEGTTCPLCRATLKRLPLDIVSEFNAAVAVRPVGELWLVDYDFSKRVGVSPRRFKMFFLSCVDCILTTELRTIYINLEWHVRIKRPKILYFYVWQRHEERRIPVRTYGRIVGWRWAGDDGGGYYSDYYPDYSDSDSDDEDWDGENDWSSWLSPHNLEPIDDPLADEYSDYYDSDYYYTYSDYHSEFSDSDDSDWDGENDWSSWLSSVDTQ
jgi:hypothetical protein